MIIGKVTNKVLNLLEQHAHVSWDDLRPTITDKISCLRVSDIAAMAWRPNISEMFGASESSERPTTLASSALDVGGAAVAGAAVGLGMAAATELADAALGGEASVMERVQRVGSTAAAAGVKTGVAHAIAQALRLLVKKGSKLAELTAAGVKGLTHVRDIAQATLVSATAVALVEAGMAIWKNMKSDTPSARGALADVLDILAKAAGDWGAKALATAAVVALGAPGWVAAACVCVAGFVGSHVVGGLFSMVTSMIR